jgi:hypothetical protein
MLLILALGLGGTVVITWLAGFLPSIGTMVTGFTWIVCLATGLGVVLSFTPLRRLEGSGASVVWTVFLYMLIVSIGAGARFAGVLGNLPLLAVGVLWMLIHAGVMLAVRRALRAPCSSGGRLPGERRRSRVRVGGSDRLPPGAGAGGRPARGARLRAGTYARFLAMAYPLRAVARLYGG